MKRTSILVLAALPLLASAPAFAAPPAPTLAVPPAPVFLAPAAPAGDAEAPETAEPPSDGPGALGVAEGPEVPEFEDPIVSALQPVAGGLTADEVVRRTVATAPQIAARQAEVEIAEAQLRQTLFRFVPSVEATASYARLSFAPLDFDTGGEDAFVVGALNEGPLGLGPCAEGSPLQCVIDSGGQPVGAFPFEFDVEDPPLNAITLQAQLGVPISDYIARLPWAKKAGKAQIQASEYARTAELLTVQKDARLAYYDWVRAIASRVALSESLARTEARLADAEASFEAGVASRADVMRLDAAAANLQAAVIRAENFERVAAQSLAVLTGETSLTAPNYSIGEDLFAPQPTLADADDLDALVEEAIAQRYEFKALEASSTAIEQNVKVARAGYYPRLDGFAEATYANPNQRFFPLEPVFNGSWSAGVSLTWVLGDALQARGQIDELRANQRLLESQRETLRRGLSIEVAAAFAERRSALAELEYTQRAVDSAAEGYRVAVDLFQVGDATTTDILDAEFQRVDTTLQRINLAIDLRVADIKVAYATGRTPPIEGAPR